MKSQLERWRAEYKRQKKEHPWASNNIIGRIASDHLKLGKKMKGDIMQWFAAMSGLAIVSILYIVFSRVYYIFLKPLEDGITNPDALTTMSLFDKIWNAWPLVFVIGFIILVLVAAQRSRGSNQY